MAAKKESNRVKPTSSAAKVRMADTKATKAAAAKAPRYPRGMQGYGMSTSKGSVESRRINLDYPDKPMGGKMGTYVWVEGATKKEANKLMKTALKSKAAGISGKQIVKQNDYTDYAEGYNRPSSSQYREYQDNKQPKVTVKKKITKK